MAAETIDLARLPHWLEAQARILEGADLTPLLKVCELLLIADAKTNFVNQSSPDGHPWAPFAASTLKNKKRGKTPLLLRDTGLLMASLAASGRQGISVMSRTGLEWGTAVNYAPFNQYGTLTTPARPFVGVGQHIADKLDRAIHDWTRGLIGGRR